MRGVFSTSNWFTKSSYSVPSSYTIELLVYLDDYVSANTNFLFYAYTGSRGFGVILNSNGVGLAAYTSAGAEYSPTFALSNSDDAHALLITFTCDGSKLRTYINGAEVGRGTTLTGTTGTGTATLGVGALDDGTYPCTDAHILYAASTDTALTPLQVRDRSRSIMARRFPALPGTAHVWIAGNTGDSSALTTHGTVSSTSAPTPFPWIRYTGRIAVVGDSTDLGSVSLAGGYVSPLLDLLLADGHHYLQPSPDATVFAGSATIYAIRGLYGYPHAGAVINDYLHAGSYPLDTEAATYRPRWLIFGAGYNDLRSEQGVTNTTLASRIIAVLDEVLAATPWVTPILKYIPTSESGDTAQWPDNDYAGYVAATASWNNDVSGRRAVVDHYAALGVRVLLEDAYGSLTYSDHVHPVDGATGYDKMAGPPYDAIISEKPA